MKTIEEKALAEAIKYGKKHHGQGSGDEWKAYEEGYIAGAYNQADGLHAPRIQPRDGKKYFFISFTKPGDTYSGMYRFDADNVTPITDFQIQTTREHKQCIAILCYREVSKAEYEKWCEAAKQGLI